MRTAVRSVPSSCGKGSGEVSGVRGCLVICFLSQGATQHLMPYIWISSGLETLVCIGVTPYYFRILIGKGLGLSPLHSWAWGGRTRGAGRNLTASSRRSGPGFPCSTSHGGGAMSQVSVCLVTNVVLGDQIPA